MTQYLKHISGGKDHSNGFVFLSQCILRAFQSCLCIFFDSKNSFSCGAGAATVGSRYMGGAPETTEHCQLNLGSRLCITGNVLGGREIIPLFTLRPQATSAGLQGGRKHLVTNWIHLVRSHGKEKWGCAQQAWSQPSPKTS